MSDVKTTGMFTGSVKGLIRIPKENKIALVVEGLITDGSMERVYLTNKSSSRGGKVIKKEQRPYLDAVLTSRVRCSVERQWDWGNNPIENFLFVFRGGLREDIRRRGSDPSQIQWDGDKLSIKECMKTIPEEYNKWCGRRRGKNKSECMKKPEIASMTDTLKKWIEFTFDREKSTVDQWWDSNKSDLEKIIADVSTTTIVSISEQPWIPTGKLNKYNDIPVSKNIKKNVIRIGGGSSKKKRSSYRKKKISR